MRLFEAHNAVWNTWVDPQHPPVRACVGADLAGIVGQRPLLCTCLVEIMVTAARYIKATLVRARRSGRWMIVVVDQISR
jgi:enamine deaminase RidA (YjgF/YER057c/UK114 family)